MKVLITGNAGMIGTVLSHYFLNKGYEVVGMDNLSGGFKRNIPDGVHFYMTDILEHMIVNGIFKEEKPDYVIHCAAYAAEILSPFIRRFNYSNNLVGSANIINACINCDVKKIVNFSSIATYGDLYPPFKETDIRQPKDCYGIAKLAVEMDLKEASEHFGLKSSTVLPHNVISKYQNYYDRYRNAIAIWIRQCMLNEDITIYGDGLQKRSFSDCKFLCEPIEKLLTGFDGEIFNVGSDNDVTIKSAAESVLWVGKEYGTKSKIVYLEPRREVKIAISDHTKAKTMLGFNDQTDLGKVIEEMFEYAHSLPKENVEYMTYEIEKNMYSFWKK
jgi:UDP-glucose 4-epimerase